MSRDVWNWVLYSARLGKEFDTLKPPWEVPRHECHRD